MLIISVDCEFVADLSWNAVYYNLVDILKAFFWFYLARSAKVAERAICFTDRNLALSAKVAERAICFTDRNFYLFFFFFNDFSETNYLKIRWTDFRNLYVEWKLFGRRWSIWTCLFDISRDVAMATDFMQKWQNSPFSSLWHSEKVWGNAVDGQD